MAIYNIKLPTYQPVVVKRKSELPKGSIPVGTGMPSYILDNQLGVSGYSNDGAENFWGITEPTWVQEPTCGPTEVVTEVAPNVSDSVLYGENCLILPGSSPIRFAGYKLWSKYQSKKGNIVPKWTIWHKKDTIATTPPPSKGSTITIKVSGKIDIRDPRINVHHRQYNWYSGGDKSFQVSLVPGQKFNEEEWKELGFYRKPDKKYPCTISDVIQIQEAQGIRIPDELTKDIQPHWFSVSENAYMTNNQAATNLAKDLQAKLGFPTDNCDKFNVSGWHRSETSIRIAINELTASDLHVAEGQMNVQSKELIFEQKHITNWPMMAVKAHLDGRTCYICQNTFDNSVYVNVNGKDNTDAELWITPDRTRHILPKHQGAGRKALQKYINDQVPDASKFRLEPPDMTDQDSVYGYVEAIKLLTSKQGIHIPAYNQTNRFIKESSPEENPRQKFQVYTEAEIKEALESEEAIKNLSQEALLTLYYSKATSSHTKDLARTTLLAKHATSSLVKFLNL